MKEDPSRLVPVFEGRDTDRRRIDIALTEVAGGFEELIGLAFLPGQSDSFVALEKGGSAHWYSIGERRGRRLFHLEVTTESEQGLLGIAFHPRYRENGRLFFHYTLFAGGRDLSRVEEWSLPPGSDLRLAAPAPVRTILEVEQPYPNHNGGHLLFGPDGLLYLGYGDGGFAGDPHGNGQDLGTLLGKMLRIDVDRVEGDRPYAVPADNPFVGKSRARPEIFAFGLRNPWRYSFAPDGRLVAGDVGQDKWEEITYVGRGDDLGWDIREGRHCFEPPRGCQTEGLVDPFYEYGHDEGLSVIGGMVYAGKRVPALSGKYVFGDFVSGRLWALELPPPAEKPPLVEAATLGKWPILPTSFAVDEAGEL
ncbi:MAG: PQQ-dependent sugar dehydrogenase, partial [Myxococcales bacterium]|nr:PQQ-dependent sugar dehydrogenase [Myxococcales bacterium]